jgi:hypothetical protein
MDELKFSNIACFQIGDFSFRYILTTNSDSIMFGQEEVKYLVNLLVIKILIMADPMFSVPVVMN